MSASDMPQCKEIIKDKEGMGYNQWYDPSYIPIFPCPPSILAYRKYHVHRSHLIYIMEKVKIFPYLLFGDCLYNLIDKRVKKDFFISQLNEGTIYRNGTTYKVVYHKTTPAFIKNHIVSLTLSFRVAQPEFNIHPIVLISVI